MSTEPAPLADTVRRRQSQGSVTDPVTIFLTAAERRRQHVQNSLEIGQRSALGQFFTPSRAADLIAQMVQIPGSGTFRVLDPGAGVGSLSAALIARVARERPDLRLTICTVEIDPHISPYLHQTLSEARQLLSDYGVEIHTEIIADDYIQLTTGWSRDYFDKFDLVLMNPPYRKLHSRSIERKTLATLGIDSPNLYTAFLSLGALALTPGGQLVAITPRSFANGPYYAPFRRFFLSHMSLDHIHVFNSRSTVFADSKVLQENIVFSAHRAASREPVSLSASDGHADSAVTRVVRYEDILRSDDPNHVVHIPAAAADRAIVEQIGALPCDLKSTGVEVSTGRVVDFRAKDWLLADHDEQSAPLVYPGNLRDGKVTWPRAIRKPQALAINESTQRMLLPNERFVLVKRFSAKEERRRVVAAVYEPQDIVSSTVAFENHLNVFHQAGHGLDLHFARGLCLWLNSSLVDRAFRTFSGHTQVNATDLRSLRYPTPAQFRHLGVAASDNWPDQQGIDELIDDHILRKAHDGK